MRPYYDHAGISIYHGDCRDVLPELSRADLLLTDPPYGIGRSVGLSHPGNWNHGGTIQRRSYPDQWDNERPDAGTFDLVLRAAKHALIWGGNFFADILPRSTHWVFWDKLQTMPTFSNYEVMWTNVPRRSVKKVTIEWNGLLGKEQFRDHPTQKPLSLMIWCLANYSEPGEVVIDPFMGSGTTLRAAKDLSRKAIGIEREEKYCKVAVERLRQESLDFSAPWVTVTAGKAPKEERGQEVLAFD